VVSKATAEIADEVDGVDVDFDPGDCALNNLATFFGL